MKKPSKTPATTRPISEVMEEVAQKLPSLVPFMFLDGSWIWYCGPALSGGENKETRELLGTRGIGFRFAPNGHLMPDKQTLGTWGHSCEAPTPRGFSHKRKDQKENSSTELSTSDLLARL